MIGGVCGVRGDVIPFGLANGDYARLEGLNIVGMKRRKFPRERIHAVRRAYQKLFLDPGRFADRLEQAAREFADDETVMQIITFIRDGHHRPLCRPDQSREE
jgi:UDP-N-acetylglucosamine acyltransferase